MDLYINGLYYLAASAAVVILYPTSDNPPVSYFLEFFLLYSAESILRHGPNSEERLPSNVRTCKCFTLGKSIFILT